MIYLPALGVVVVVGVVKKEPVLAAKQIIVTDHPLRKWNLP